MSRPKRYKCAICKEYYFMTVEDRQKRFGRADYRSCLKVECRTLSAIKHVDKNKKLKQKVQRAEWRKEKTAIKKKLGLVKQDHLQTRINKIVHHLDKGKPCLANPTYSDKALEAGHVIPISRYKHLRYNLLNIHLQGNNSNRSQKDDLRMLEGLEIRYGKDIREEVEHMHQDYHIKAARLTKDEKKEKLKIVNEIIRELEREEIDLSDGIQVRRDLNKRIGIYE